MVAPPLATVFGCSGQTLCDDERAFFRDADPLGFILFARNVNSSEQVCALVSDLRASVQRNAPILIDQEGGRVQRLRAPQWRTAPPMQHFGDLYRKSPEQAARALRLNMQVIGQELADLGIDVNCAPCLDVPVPGAHDVIGDRAISSDSTIVADLAQTACEGLIDAGIVPVIKHLPGHGRATLDSHESLPIVETEKTDIEKSDLQPFKRVKALPVAAMTAHVVYASYDNGAPATLSKSVIENLIREQIGFTGLLFSDDLGMKALSGTFKERARSCLGAGCDIALHCSGDLNEMVQVASGSSVMTEEALSSISLINAYRGRSRVEIDRSAVAFEVASLLQAAA